MVLENLVLGVALALVVFTWIIQGYHISKIKKIFKEPADSGDVLKAVIGELNRRLDRQDRKILDQQVKLDILETRLERFEETPIKEKMDIIQQRVSTPSTSQKIIASQVSHPSPESLDPTAKQVLELLVSGPKSPRQIQAYIGKSREHTARLMKRLFEQGFVDRDELKRPFMYGLKRRE